MINELVNKAVPSYLQPAIRKVVALLLPVRRLIRMWRRGRRRLIRMWRRGQGQRRLVRVWRSERERLVRMWCSGRERLKRAGYSHKLVKKLKNVHCEYVFRREMRRLVALEHDDVVPADILSGLI